MSDIALLSSFDSSFGPVVLVGVFGGCERGSIVPRCDAAEVFWSRFWTAILTMLGSFDLDGYDCEEVWFSLSLSLTDIRPKRASSSEMVVAIFTYVP